MHLPKGLLDRPFKLVLPVLWCLSAVFSALGIEVAYETRDHLGIGLARKFHPFALQPGLQRAVVLDDAVVYKSDLAAIVQMRMCVYRARLSVGRPTCVADAERLGTVGLAQDLLESTDPATALGDPYSTAAKQRYAGRIVPAILQPFQPLNKDRLGNFPTEICNYTTHSLFTIGDFSSRIQVLCFFMENCRFSLW